MDNYANVIFPDGWIMEQKGATSHTFRYTKNFFKENNIWFLQWRPNSPDINPVQNVWTILQTYVAEKTPKAKEELLQFILESQPGYYEEIWWIQYPHIYLNALQMVVNLSIIILNCVSRLASF